MVGYDKNDTLTANQKFIAGSVSGMTTRFITQPIDVVKLRIQLQKNTTHNRTLWIYTARKILKEEGITAFWHGHNLGQIYSIFGVTSQFFVYEMSTKYIASTFSNDKNKKMLVFMSGILAGCCSAALVIPLEVIRVRQMLVKDQYRGIFNGAREVYNSGGWLAFYEGLSASLLQMGPQVGISFAVFGFFHPLILNYIYECKGESSRESSAYAQKPQYLLIASMLAGTLAGFVSKSVTYPMDLVKRRLQIGSLKTDSRYKVPSTSRNLIKCRKLTECLSQTYRKEGFMGLYRGWKITVYKAQITSLVAFTTYELMCHLFREIANK